VAHLKIVLLVGGIGVLFVLAVILASFAAHA
jgi:hypothetical protein